MTIEELEKFEAVWSSDRRLQADKWDNREKRMVVQAIKIIWEYWKNDNELRTRFSHDENINTYIKHLIWFIWASMQYLENYKECKKQWLDYDLFPTTPQCS